MVRFGRYNVGVRSNSAMTIVAGIVTLLITAVVGDKIIGVLKQVLDFNSTGAVFFSMYQFLGVQGLGQNSIIGVIGILLGAGLILRAFKISRLH